MSIVLDGSNGISIPSGSLSNPSLKSSSDADTGLFFPSANIIALSIDGSQKVSFYSNGLTEFEEVSISGNLIVTGTTSLSDLDFSDPVFSGNVTVQSQGDVRFEDADSSNFVALQAPSTVASNVTFTLPSADGNENQVLKTDGSGNFGFADPGASTGKAIAMSIVFG